MHENLPQQGKQTRNKAEPNEKNVNNVNNVNNVKPVANQNTINQSAALNNRRLYLNLIIYITFNINN